MEAGATVQEWLGTTAAEAQLTMKAFIAEMGVRAMEGHGAQWRNWSRVFSIRVLAKLYPDAALSEEITGMEAVVPQMLSCTPCSRPREPRAMRWRHPNGSRTKSEGFLRTRSQGWSSARMRSCVCRRR